MQLPELLERIQKLEIHCKRISGQKLSGIFSSRFKGRGIILDSVRKYDIAEDVRNINWSVTARFQETHVNTYIEDKAQLFWLIVDVSKSGIFGTGLKSKFDLSIEIAASIAYSVLESKNTIGVIFFNEDITSVIQPARGQKHFWHIAGELVRIQPKGKGTDLSKALNYVYRTVKKHSNIFIISDFLTKGYSPVCKIIAQKHEINAIMVYDKAELRLPGLGWIKLKDAENGQVGWFNSNKSDFNNHYGDTRKLLLSEFDFFRQSGWRSLTLSTASDHFSQLIDFLKR
jgi:uncharacterized protein (DUF58 family)